MADEILPAKPTDNWQNILPFLKALAPEYPEYQPPVMDPNATPGKVGPGEPNNWPQLATDVAGSLPGLGGKAAAGAMMKAIFAGPMAKTADLDALKAAQRLATAGYDKADIWHHTGWFTGPEGLWRHEIPDQGARARISPELPPENWEGNARYKLGELLHHPKFYRAYPEAKEWNADIFYGPEAEGLQRSGAPPSIYAAGPDPSTREKVVLHELQHGVQDIEGFGPGGNPQAIADRAGIQAAQELGAIPSTSLADKIWKASHKAYRNLPGETEARNIETRFDLPEALLKHAYPWETQDVSTRTQALFTPWKWLEQQHPAVRSYVQALREGTTPKPILSQQWWR